MGSVSFQIDFTCFDTFLILRACLQYAYLMLKGFRKAVSRRQLAGGSKQEAVRSTQ